MTWRCGAKKADGKTCRCAVAAKGSKCQHHKLHKGKPLGSKKKSVSRNPLAAFNNLQDRWALPPMPKGTIK